MTTFSEDKKLTELSAAIDAVNRGERPDSQDKELRELAEVALLLKRSGPPPAAVAALADTLSGELAARTKRRRLWMTSGTAGTAAAVLLVIALNLNPAAPTPPPLAIPPTGSVVIEAIPSQPAPDTAQTEEAPLAKAEVKPQEKAEKRATMASEPAKAPEPAKQPEKTAEPAVAQVTARETPPTVAFLAWPGRQPERSAVDKSGAAVRQVYSVDSGEVVITQRATSRTTAAAVGEPKTAAVPDGGEPPVTKKADTKVNRVTATVKGFVVTVEGSQSEDELWKIAQSLE